MRNRRIPFEIQYQYGVGDLYEIVNDLAKDTVIKSSHPRAIQRRAKKYRNANKPYPDRAGDVC